jgi:putative SOS response-associated peptidase YedK
MCNLYSELKGQAALRDLFAVDKADDLAGNLPALPAIFPDNMAPVVRLGDDGRRKLEMLRWGFPPAPGKDNRPVTNARHLESRYWQPWLKAENRCLVPATSFCEPSDAPGPDGKKIWTWFALGESRPLFAFAGLWRPWSGTRGTKARPVEGEHILFSFLTTAANEIVKPVHKKAMPVILTTPDEIETWLSAPAKIALELQRPLAAEP